MADSSNQTSTKQGITQIAVSGFKSIANEQSIEVRPLTILAGTNSSGKSSIMQPLLLLKQTLEASYDPGPLLLNGPNVKFTSSEQLLSRVGGNKSGNMLMAGVGIGSGDVLRIYFRCTEQGFEIDEMTKGTHGDLSGLRLGMTHIAVQSWMKKHPGTIPSTRNPFYERGPLSVIRNRCFLDIAVSLKEDRDSLDFVNIVLPRIYFESLHSNAMPRIIQLIHLPGLRGNPERTYPVAASGPNFPGTFEKYTASVIAHWQDNSRSDQLENLTEDLSRLGLTRQVAASRVNDISAELKVGRMPSSTRSSGKADMINIADVGLGVSQTLPVLVALRAAKSEQMVYIEQPEIHLHPRAQTAMAQVLADAANRGVRVVAETHSSLLILGIQTLVAEGKLSPDLVKLHWFKRAKNGSTEINSADLDESGAFGDWPEDFADVSLEAQSRYLDAAEARQWKH